jgi:hypothetical protein
MKQAEDVVRHLGKKEMHWQEGRSAHALASLWFRHNDFPPRVKAVLQTHPDFQSAELVDAFMERQVDLGSEGRPSQTDLLAIAGLDPRQLAIIAVEGKAGESFGDLVEQWLDGSDGKEARLNSLCALLGLSREAALPLRYQLLHRTASAILEAKRYRASVAALLVHSFSDDQKGFADFRAAIQALGLKDPSSGFLMGPAMRGGVSLYAGWVKDQAPRGDMPSTYLDDLRKYAENTIAECDRMRNWCNERSSELNLGKAEGGCAEG